MSLLLTSARLVLIIAMLGTLNACWKYKLARPEHMVPESILFASYSPDSPLSNAIAISKVGGGEKTKPLSSLPKVDSNELHEGLRLSLNKYGFLSASEVAAPFRLEVFLVELKQPYGGFTKIVTSVIRYKLTRSCDDQVVYDDIITASYTATLEDAFDGGYRLKLANEGSIRANIAAFLRHLHSLKIMKSPVR